MHKLIKISAVTLTFLLLSGCQNNPGNPELNQCAQQNYQCENSCEQQSTAEGLKQQVCSSKCIEQYNQCKAQAENLADM